ncbi:MAG: hypothetical protein Q8Q02_11035 [Nocardioides sp.]|nr:hypothetical protein [Nocardioides sp.]
MSGESSTREIAVRAGCSWRPTSTWTPTSAHVDGRLTSGERVDVGTCACAAVDAATYAAARQAWLHGAVLRADDTLLVPGVLTEPMVAEALRRRGFGAVEYLPRTA